MKYIDATRIEQWSKKKDAQSSLPELVRRLIINSSNNVYGLCIPSGDSVSKPGLDGKFMFNSPDVLYGDITSDKCEDNFQTVYMEVSTQEKWQDKFKPDIKKRTESFKDKCEEIIFIFITSRKAVNKDSVVEDFKQKSSYQWKDIKIFDADDLEKWIDQDFATMAWLCWKMNIPCSLQSPKMYFSEWLESTIIPLDENVIFSRLDKERRVDKLFNDFIGSKEKYTLSVMSDSCKESILYSIKKLERLSKKDIDKLSGNILKTKIIIIKDKPTWDYVISNEKRNNYILIPTFGIPDNLGFVNKNIKVILPLNKSEKSDVYNHSKVVKLEELNRDLLIKNLQIILENEQYKLYKKQVDIYSIVDESKNTLLPLQRLLVKPNSPLPHAQWMNEESPLVLLKLSMVNKFSLYHDKVMLEKFVGKPFEEIEVYLKYLLHQEEPVVKFYNSYYEFVNTEHILIHYSQYITETVLNNLQKHVIQAISKQINNKINEYPKYGEHISKNLINGVFETLAILGHLLDKDEIQHYGKKFLLNAVQSFLKETLSYELWNNLKNLETHFLIEASHEEVLKVFKFAILDQQEDKIIEIFYKGIPSNYSFLSNNDLIIEFLWLLEKLSLIRECINDVIKILTKLITIEQGIRYKSGNSALKTLFSIFNPCNNKSNLSFEEKFEFIKKIVEDPQCQNIKIAIIEIFLFNNSWIISNVLPFKYKTNYNPTVQDEASSKLIPFYMFFYEQLIEVKKGEAVLKILSTPDIYTPLLTHILKYIKEKKIIALINKDKKLAVNIKVRIVNLKKYNKDEYLLEFINDIDGQILVGSDIEQEIILCFHDISSSFMFNDDMSEFSSILNKYYEEKGIQGILKIIEESFIPSGYKLIVFISAIIKNLDLDIVQKKQIVNLLVKKGEQGCLQAFFNEYKKEHIVDFYNAYYNPIWTDDQKLLFLTYHAYINKAIVDWLTQNSLEELYWSNIKNCYVDDNVEELDFVINTLKKYEKYDLLLEVFTLIIRDNYHYDINISLLLDAIVSSNQSNNYYIGFEYYDEYIKKHVDEKKDFNLLVNYELIRFRLMSFIDKKPNFNKDYPNLKKAIENYQLDNPFFIDLLRDNSNISQAVYHLMTNINFIPCGYFGVREWVNAIREKSKEIGIPILNKANNYIAVILSKSEADPDDNIFPHKVIREILESEPSESFISIFTTSILNSYGVYCVDNKTTQDFYDKYLQFEEWSKAERLLNYPVTKKILKELANRYKERSERNNKDVNFGIN